MTPERIEELRDEIDEIAASARDALHRVEEPTAALLALRATEIARSLAIAAAEINEPVRHHLEQRTVWALPAVLRDAAPATVIRVLAQDAQNLTDQVEKSQDALRAADARALELERDLKHARLWWWCVPFAAVGRLFRRRSPAAAFLRSYPRGRR